MWRSPAAMPRPPACRAPIAAASAWGGSLADRYGRRRVLWPIVLLWLGGIALTLMDALPMIVLGIAVVTAAFFAAYAVASSWVTRRAGAAKAQAVSLYMFFPYMGSSVLGTVGGVVYADSGWPGEAATQPASRPSSGVRFGPPTAAAPVRRSW